MFLRCIRRKKDGKEHRYWSIAESRRCAGGKVVQRPVLYLGEINDSQRAAWCRVIEGFDEDRAETRPLALFPWDREVPAHAADCGVGVRLKDFELHRPRQWGACWLACHLYEQLGLDEFWAGRLADSREGTRWRHILQTLVCYRLIDPGSEWRLHRRLAHPPTPAIPRRLLGGSSAVRWAICSARIFRWRKRTRSIASTTSSWNTSRRSSPISPHAGRISSARNSRCCSTT